MKYVIDILNDKRKEIVNELKKQDTDRIINLKNLKSVDKALKWLNTLEKNNIESADKFEVLRLPYQENCFATYRLMIDNEAESVQDLDFTDTELFPDDIIFKRK
ncbi:MAG: hypothetical protein K2G63_05615 [Oscillospiraceae bacterium]|nr:hypothetical protein [Oscillospiraceae bacterium]